MFGKGSKKSAGGSSSNKAQKEPKVKYAASTVSEKKGKKPTDNYPSLTVSEKMAKRSATSLDAFYNKSENVNAEIDRVRVVVHTWGDRKSHDGKSVNHWSMFLLIRGRTASVRLNMSSDGLDEYGHFGVEDKNYLESHSQLEHFDFPVPRGITVNRFLTLITGRGRNRYIMSGTGNGCRYWV
jgi:hypothetical protein